MMQVGLVWSIVIVLTLEAVVQAQPNGFSAYDLGDLGCEYHGAIAYALNDLGMVGGITSADGICTHGVGFLWINGLMIDLPANSDGLDTSRVEGIDRSGEIILASGSGTQDIVVLRDSVMYVLDVPSGCDANSPPDGMNTSGQLGVGSCSDSSQEHNNVASLYNLTDFSAVRLPLPPDIKEGGNSWAYDVNDDGVVVGYYDYPDGKVRAFVYRDGVMTQLVNTLGGDPICADAISNSGFIAGGAQTETDYCAMRYNMHTGEMICLGSGNADDVNERGDVVGLDIIDTMDHAMLYKDGLALDLNVFLPAYMENAIAHGINNYGWIAGEAFDSNFVNYWAWLLVPLYAKGDYDGDDDVDLHDFGHFQECYAAEPYQGPEGGLHVGCSVFDFDDDVDLDGVDFAAFQAAFTGAITSGW